jgi:hypothetical protein
MHLELPHRTYTGPAIDDPDILERLPSELDDPPRRDGVTELEKPAERG